MRQQRTTRARSPQPSANLLTPREVAAMLRVNRDTVYVQCRRGVLPKPIRIGQRIIRWRRADIERFLANGGTGGPSDAP